MIGAALLAGSAASAASMTNGERASLLQSTGFSGSQVSGSSTARTSLDLVTEIERSILRVNRGNAASSLRRPVSSLALRGLQLRLAQHGQPMPMSRLEPMVDYGQALMRESGGKVSLSEKVSRLPKQLRKPFHGNVAEFAEARARGMVLTQDRTATTWDLTESRYQPRRNYQMKILARPGKALSSLIDDLGARADYVKRGITTQRTLDWGLKTGELVRNDRTYSPINRPSIQLEASKAFSRPGKSQRYARLGREGLIRGNMSSSARLPINDIRLKSYGRWAGRLGIAALLATEGYAAHGYYTGRISKRDFVTINAGLAGSVAGAATGSAMGSIVAGPGGTLIGGTVGGVLGYFGGNQAAGSYYSRLDEQSKRQVEEFIYQLYGVT